ncbi:MAG: adenosylcobinamide-GDP ribazoletransferase [Nitrospirota bacterium]|nr:adenosylcobinamide-GDP ribazoletransferase [Nitrospirota bacterium]
MRRFLTAWNFLTVIPLLPPRDLKADDIACGMAFFPAVGIVLGLLMAGVWWFASPHLSVSVLAALILALPVVLTGAIHVDGFVDTLDGLAVMGDRERRLAVMKDSRIGAVGAVGLVLLFLLKLEAVKVLNVETALAALVLMPTVGRWAMVMTAWRSRYPRSDGTGKASVEALGGLEVAAASVIAAVPAIYLLGVGLVAPLVLVVAGVLVIRWLAHKSFGGVTGDVIGASNECAEVLFLLGVLL